MHVNCGTVIGQSCGRGQYRGTHIPVAAQQWEVEAARGEPAEGEGEVGLAWRALRHLQKHTQL